MAETSNDLRPRVLFRIGGGVAVATVIVLSGMAFSSRGRPSLGDLPKATSPSGPTLESRLMPLIRAHQGKVAIAVKPLGSGESFRYHADEVMPTASLIKFPVMIEAYRQAADKKIDLDSFITLKKQDKVGGSGVLNYHFSDGATFKLRDAIRLMIVLLGQHGHEPGPRRHRHRRDGGDHGEDGLSQYQDSLEGLSPRYLGLPRAEQAVRPGEHDAGRDGPALRGRLSQTDPQPLGLRRDAGDTCAPATTGTSSPGSCRRRPRSRSRPAASPIRGRPPGSSNARPGRSSSAS